MGGRPITGTGNGHFYQGRSKIFPVQSGEHFFVVCHYVERNAVAAGLASTAEAWRFGSFDNWRGGKCGIKLSPWTLRRPPNWVQRVNCPLSENQATQIRRAIGRSQPFGHAGWVESTARKYNLKSTLRKLGRPRKFPHATK